MWFIGVEVEQETSAPPPKKILDPPLLGHECHGTDNEQKKVTNTFVERNETNRNAK